MLSTYPSLKEYNASELLPLFRDRERETGYQLAQTRISVMRSDANHVIRSKSYSYVVSLASGATNDLTGTPILSFT